MLVINCVKFISLDQTEEMREFQSENSICVQENLQSLDKIIQVRNLRQHVVSEHQVRSAAFRDQFLRKLYAEEPRHRGDTLFNRRFVEIGGRLDTQHRHLTLYQVLKQIT